MTQRDPQTGTRGLTRREILTSTAALAVASVLPGCAGPHDPVPSGSASKLTRAGSFRFVHLTDIHVEPELDGDKGFAKALMAVESLRPRPDFILTGGDLVFDAYEASPQRARELFTLYKKVIADHTSLVVHPCLGNHDIFGWRSPGVDAKSPGYGKAMAMDFLGMTSPCYEFDHKGWKFFVLDNVQPAQNEHGYGGGLSPEHTEWFSAALRQTPSRQPIIVCEHIPLMSVTAFGHDESLANGSWGIGPELVCGDATARLKLLRERNVRLSLSGHMHERDRIEYLGTTFINDGAVCGAWWKGAYRGVEEGFGVFDVHRDGTFDYQYLDYGWEAREKA